MERASASRPPDRFRASASSINLDAVGAVGTISADQGADVIKVEEPRQGDHTRSYGNRRNGFSASFLNLNRNKRSVAIDLKTPQGVDLVKRLCAGADVLVQNFRPGVVERLGVDEAAIRRIAPSIVYVSISGFGEKGPYAPVYDDRAGLSGLTTVQAGLRPAAPRLIRTVLPDKLTAVTVAGDFRGAGGATQDRQGPARAPLHARRRAGLPVGLRTWARRPTWAEGLAADGGELHRPDLRDAERVHDRGRHDQQGMGGTDPRARAPRLLEDRASRPACAARREHRHAPADDAGRAEDAHHRGLAGAAGEGRRAVRAGADTAIRSSPTLRSLRATSCSSDHPVAGSPAANADCGKVRDADGRATARPRLGEHNGEILRRARPCPGRDIAQLRRQGVCG